MIDYVPVYLQQGISWWKDTDMFKHSHLLISAYYGRKTPDFREELEIPKTVKVFGDSGGFQNMTQEAILDPIQVVKWQERNCDAGFIFDLPIFQNDSWEIKCRKQDETVENAYIALNNKKSNMTLYAIIQGHTLEEQKRILSKYIELGNPLKFNGWAIGGLVPLAGNTLLLTKILTTFCKLIDDLNPSAPLHFFGLSGMKVIPIIAYLSKTFNKEITFDSSSYMSGMMRKEYWMDYGKFSFNIGEDIKLKTLPCQCEICRNSTIQEFTGINGGSLITLHNLKQTISFTQILYSLADDKDMLIKYCNSDTVRKSIRFIDYTKEHGLEKALKNISEVHIQSSKTHSLIKYKR